DVRRYQPPCGSTAMFFERSLCGKSDLNEVAPSPLLRPVAELCSTPTLNESLVRDSIAWPLDCIVVPSGNDHRKAENACATPQECWRPDLDNLHGLGFPASSSRRGAPPALIRAKTPQAQKSSAGRRG